MFIITESITELASEFCMSELPNTPYRPAKLRQYKSRALIEFYALDASTGQLKRKQVTVPASLSKIEAKAWAKRKIEQINKLLALGYAFNVEKKNEAPPAPSNLTVKKAFYQMLDLIEKEMRPETLKSYKSCYKLFMSWAQSKKIDALPVEQLNSQHIAAFLDSITLAGKSARTYNNFLKMLAATGAKLLERGHIKANFGKGIKKRKEEQAPNTPFTAEELATLEQWMLANNRPLWLACKMIYYAFIRPIELTRLKAGDVDLHAGHIKCLASTSKNKKLEYVPISKQLRLALEKYGFSEIPAEHYLFGNGSKLTPGSTPTIRPRLSDAHLEAMRACNLEGRGKSLYTWKDTGAVNAYKAGIDIMTLQSLLRHHSVAMTEIYLASLGLMVKENIEGKEW